MDKDFWLERWEHQETAFHYDSVNPLLTRFLPEFHIKKNGHIFVPLCGKTGDMTWLHEQGYQITGVELSELAVQEYFQIRGVMPSVQQYGSIREFSMPNLRILQGDFFQLLPHLLGEVDLVYDRASMVALPEEMRSRYVTQLKKQCKQAELFLITYSFEVEPEAGPPFSIMPSQVADVYPSATVLYSEKMLGHERFEARGAREHVFQSIL